MKNSNFKRHIKTEPDAGRANLSSCAFLLHRDPSRPRNVKLDEGNVDPQRVFSFFGAQRRKKNFFRPIFPSTSVGMEDVEWEVVEASGDAEATDVYWVVDWYLILVNIFGVRPKLWGPNEVKITPFWNKILRKLMFCNFSLFKTLITEAIREWLLTFRRHCSPSQTRTTLTPAWTCLTRTRRECRRRPSSMRRRRLTMATAACIRHVTPVSSLSKGW